ncbi:MULTISPECIES: hypothetical protein [Carnobacterium]|uniref:Uncharacterized protein n=2 Tax=Carnobacterium inhibens TaxID=147709 RepID=U5SCN6_9LACT|nr:MULTISPECIES: hypothetical protein [Carnobacterium]AGY82806.1 hypothetical protein Q783_06030 [Carnobacterium inhibens subsp. gilichinskyi]MBC9826303.1 hypothetical protein [Carnobacterium inhibens]MDN5372832.1 hypothetical protein [Carnobacterium sp.]
MIYLLMTVVLVLGGLTYIQATEINKLKSLFSYNQSKMIKDALEYLKVMNEIQTIKNIRQDYYPIDLVQAKKIVEKAKSRR